MNFIYRIVAGDPVATFQFLVIAGLLIGALHQFIKAAARKSP